MNKTRLFSFPNTRFNECGSVAIEFGIIAPIMIIFLLGVIEFGWYFLKYEVTARAVASIAAEIQNPTNAYPSTTGAPANGSCPTCTLGTQGQEYTDAVANGGALIPFGTAANTYICADAYTTLALAQVGGCTLTTDWNTMAPTGVTAGTPYYVYIKAHVPPDQISSFSQFWGGTFMLNINQVQIVQVGSSATTSSGGITGGCFTGDLGGTQIVAGVWGVGCLDNVAVVLNYGGTHPPESGSHPAAGTQSFNGSPPTNGATVPAPGYSCGPVSTFYDGSSNSWSYYLCIHQ